MRLFLFRYTELVLVFVMLPILYYLNLIYIHKFIPLILVFSLFLFIILSDKSFNRKYLGFNSFNNYRKLFLRFGIFVIVTIPVVYFFRKDLFFYLPTHNFKLWIFIMIFYPVFSVFPQEFLYRTFIFHRYSQLFKNKYVMMAISSILFMFVHIIFRNQLALILTLAGGWLFSQTYSESKSLLIAFIEHTLYGNWIFTIGIGNFFYLPLNH